MISGLYDLLEELICAQYEHHKLARLEALNSKLDILRYQSRLLLKFELLSMRRYELAIQRLHEIGNELGGWIKYQRKKHQ